jgi:hypothetical protein
MITGTAVLVDWGHAVVYAGTAIPIDWGGTISTPGAAVPVDCGGAAGFTVGATIVVPVDWGGAVMLSIPATAAAIPNDGGSTALCPTTAVLALPVDRGGAAPCPATGTASVVVLCKLCKTTKSLATRNSKTERLGEEQNSPRHGAPPYEAPHIECWLGRRRGLCCGAHRRLHCHRRS